MSCALYVSGVKYQNTPVTCIEIPRYRSNVRGQFTLEMKTESLLLISSDKLFHSLIEEDKKRIEILRSS